MRRHNEGTITTEPATYLVLEADSHFMPDAVDILETIITEPAAYLVLEARFRSRNCAAVTNVPAAHGRSAGAVTKASSHSDMRWFLSVVKITEATAHTMAEAFLSFRSDDGDIQVIINYKIITVES